MTENGDFVGLSVISLHVFSLSENSHRKFTLSAIDPANYEALMKDSEAIGNGK